MSKQYRLWHTILTALLLAGCGTVATPFPTPLPAATRAPTLAVLTSLPPPAATMQLTPPTVGPTPVSLPDDYLSATTFPIGYQITVTADPPSGVAPLTVRLRATVVGPDHLPCFTIPAYNFGDGPGHRPALACGVEVPGPHTPTPTTVPTRVPPVMSTFTSEESHTYQQLGTYHAFMILTAYGKDLRGDTIVQVQ